MKKVCNVLGVHPRTGEDLLKRAALNLGAKSREQAIVHAALAGEIDWEIYAALTTSTHESASVREVRMVMRVRPASPILLGAEKPLEGGRNRKSSG